MFDDHEIQNKVQAAINYDKEMLTAIVNLDEGEIRRFCAKWNFTIPVDPDPEVFWTGIHIARALNERVPRDKRADSAMWLTERGIDLKGYVI